MPPMAMSSGTTLYNKTGSWRSMKPVLDENKCIKCGTCWKFCPNACISATEYPEFDLEYCKGCGICAEECPVDAIKMVREW
ncbi:MAG: 4Fe-4S binding protein [Euryarchaeota archaeon]|nr:4Fe-4S binding protein [Euryarchaeota archaeon]